MEPKVRRCLSGLGCHGRLWGRDWGWFASADITPSSTSGVAGGLGGTMRVQTNPQRGIHSGSRPWIMLLPLGGQNAGSQLSAK